MTQLAVGTEVSSSVGGLLHVDVVALDVQIAPRIFEINDDQLVLLHGEHKVLRRDIAVEIAALVQELQDLENIDEDLLKGHLPYSALVLVHH